LDCVSSFLGLIAYHRLRVKLGDPLGPFSLAFFMLGG
jgi:hypothetical protein